MNTFYYCEEQTAGPDDGYAPNAPVYRGNGTQGQGQAHPSPALSHTSASSRTSSSTTSSSRTSSSTTSSSRTSSSRTSSSLSSVPSQPVGHNSNHSHVSQIPFPVAFPGQMAAPPTPPAQPAGTRYRPPSQVKRSQGEKGQYPCGDPDCVAAYTRRDSLTKHKRIQHPELGR